ncbi:hypothetical protein K438DRAFT_1927079 [Mycena galopus ATCC 62051]|nr:hypothetical protein K438DRAFT_1927079 [Mycena galopus ATCC 62051]
MSMVARWNCLNSPPGVALHFLTPAPSKRTRRGALASPFLPPAQARKVFCRGEERAVRVRVRVWLECGGTLGRSPARFRDERCGKQLYRRQIIGDVRAWMLVWGIQIEQKVLLLSESARVRIGVGVTEVLRDKRWACALQEDCGTYTRQILALVLDED